MKLIFQTNFTINHDNYEILEKYVDKECKIGNEYNCFYDIYCDNTYISKINKNRLHNFIHYIENYNNENIYKYSLVLHKKEYHNKLNLNIKIFADFDKIYEKLINNNLSKNELDYFCYHFIWKGELLKKNVWKLQSFPNNIKCAKQPKNINIKLFKYQLQTLNLMKKIENEKESNKIINKNSFYEIFKEDRFKEINFDTLKKKITNDSFSFKINGGILADEMGLGKTLTSISLILDKPYIYKPNKEENNFKYEMRDDKLMCKATIIFCPSHLTKQWSGEIKKSNKNIKQILILTQTNHKKYLIKDILEYDIVIVSFQFLCNQSYYLNIVNWHYKWTMRNLECSGSCDDRFKVVNKSFKFNKDKIDTSNLIIEKIHWYRVIIDEAHELFRTCYLENNYLQHFLKNIKSDNRWYISGTPFHNMYTLTNVLNFLDFKIKIDDKYYCNINECLDKGLSENNIMRTIKNQVYIRNTKESVKDQISIPKANIENIILEFSDFEKKLYQSLSKYKNESYLRMLCCNIQVSDQFFSDNINILNFDEVKEKLITYNKNKIKKTEISLACLSPVIPNYNAIKKRLENIIISCNYLINSFENNCKINNENCPICQCEFDDPIITDCGHHFCYECINQALDFNKKECPICRQNIDKSKIFKLDDIKKDENSIDTLVFQYGTKLAKLIKLCNQILLNPDNKIIIFSEYDKLLNMIGNILKINNINNVFCKGNVHQRNMAISTFRKDSKSKKKDTKVIMLSTEHAASGTNLTEANHIIFMESHEGEYANIKTMEDQAIGRAVRLGQENQVNVIRLIIKDTIEEELFNKYINEN
jgi:SNF2 family DNA or RNA helicase